MGLIATHDRSIKPLIGDFFISFDSYGIWKAGLTPHNEAWMRFMREVGYPDGWTSQDMSDMANGRKSFRDILKGMFDKAFEDMLMAEAGDLKDIMIEIARFASAPDPEGYIIANDRRLQDMGLKGGRSRSAGGDYYSLFIGRKIAVPLQRILTDSFKRVNKDYWPALIRVMEYIEISGQSYDVYAGGPPKIANWPGGDCFADMSIWMRAPELFSLDPRMRGMSLAWIWNVRLYIRRLGSCC